MIENSGRNAESVLLEALKSRVFTDSNGRPFVFEGPIAQVGMGYSIGIQHVSMVNQKREMIRLGDSLESREYGSNFIEQHDNPEFVVDQDFLREYRSRNGN